VNVGNVTMDQTRLAPNRTSAFMGSWQDDLSGNTFSSNQLTGRSAVSLLRNQGFASRVVSLSVSEQEVNEAGQQAEAARTEASSASRDALGLADGGILARAESGSVGQPQFGDLVEPV
jgi:conjugal transfer mating pair stabilization protein TraG